MKRGDIVTVVLPGDLGKPRPAVILQTNFVPQTSAVLVVPFSSTLSDVTIFRTLVEPTPDNGLRETSQAMLDKITNVRREKIGRVIGRLDDALLTYITKQAVFMIGGSEI